MEGGNETLHFQACSAAKHQGQTKVKTSATRGTATVPSLIVAVSLFSLFLPLRLLLSFHPPLLFLFVFDSPSSSASAASSSLFSSLCTFIPNEKEQGHGERERENNTNQLIKNG